MGCARRPAQWLRVHVTAVITPDAEEYKMKDEDIRTSLLPSDGGHGPADGGAAGQGADGGAGHGAADGGAAGQGSDGGADGGAH